MFYRKVREPRSETELQSIANWAMRKGIHRLNKRMKKKYGMSLEDVFLQEEPDEYADEYEEEFVDDMDGSGEDYYDEEYDEVDQFFDENPDDQNAEYDDGYYEDEYGDEYYSDGGMAGEEYETGYAEEYEASDYDATPVDGIDVEDDVDPVENSMVTKLQRFYAKHDPTKGENGKIVRANIEYILNHGVEAFNRILVQKYGESLNSLLGRKQTLSKFKQNKRSRAGSEKSENAHAMIEGVL